MLVFSLSITTPEISSVSSIPSFFIFSIFIFDKSIFPFSSICFIAVTKISEKFSFEFSAHFPVMAVIAICLKISSLSSPICKEIFFKISCDFSFAILYPFVITVGCIFLSSNFSAFSKSFPANITAVVVPSPTSFS